MTINIIDTSKMGFATAVSEVQKEKDYYRILEVDPSATPE